MLSCSVEQKAPCLEGPLLIWHSTVAILSFLISEQGTPHFYFVLPWRREWQPTPVSLRGGSHGQRSLAGSIGSHRVGHDWSDLARTHVVNYEASPAPRIKDCPALVCPFQTLRQDPRWDSPATPASSPHPSQLHSVLLWSVGQTFCWYHLPTGSGLTWKRVQDFLQISIRISGWHFSGGFLVGLKYLWGRILSSNCSAPG